MVLRVPQPNGQFAKPMGWEHQVIRLKVLKERPHMMSSFMIHEVLRGSHAPHMKNLDKEVRNWMKEECQAHLDTLSSIEEDKARLGKMNLNLIPSSSSVASRNNISWVKQQLLMLALRYVIREKETYRNCVE